MHALPALYALADFLERSGSILSRDEALDAAIREWIAAREGGDIAYAASAAGRRPGGYQWKCLFLAHGSELRVFHDGRYHYAEVRNDLLVHENRPISPRQFALAVFGEPRNAWRELWVRRPSDARSCRRHGPDIEYRKCRRQADAVVSWSAEGAEKRMSKAEGRSRTKQRPCQHVRYGKLPKA